MTRQIEREKVLAAATQFIASELGFDGSVVDYEIQDAGKFILFRARNIENALNDVKVRSSIHKELATRLSDFNFNWMLAVLNGTGDVIDEIDSIAGY